MPEPSTVYLSRRNRIGWPPGTAAVGMYVSYRQPSQSTKAARTACRRFQLDISCREMTSGAWLAMIDVRSSTVRLTRTSAETLYVTMRRPAVTGSAVDFLADADPEEPRRARPLSSSTRAITRATGRERWVRSEVIGLLLGEPACRCRLRGRARARDS